MTRLEPSDRDVVKWATDHALPWYYTSEEGLPGPCLKVQCGHVTAYFHQGRLRRLWAHADRPEMDDMFLELARLMQLNSQASLSQGVAAFS